MGEENIMRELERKFGALVVFKRTLRLDLPDTVSKVGGFTLFRANAVKHF